MRGGRSSTSFKTYVWVTCKHCNYRWRYTGSANYATCPSCGGKTPVYPYITTINNLFNKLKENVATSDDERYKLEVLRVILIKYIRDRELDIKLLEELLHDTKTRIRH